MDTKDQKDDGIIDDTYAEGTGEETVLEVDHIAERQLCRKFDVRLMPVLAIMCKTLHLSNSSNRLTLSRPLQRSRQRESRQCPDCRSQRR